MSSTWKLLTWSNPELYQEQLSWIIKDAEAMEDKKILLHCYACGRQEGILGAKEEEHIWCCSQCTAIQGEPQIIGEHYREYEKNYKYLDAKTRCPKCEQPLEKCFCDESPELAFEIQKIQQGMADQDARDGERRSRRTELDDLIREASQAERDLRNREIDENARELMKVARKKRKGVTARKPAVAPPLPKVNWDTVTNSAGAAINFNSTTISTTPVLNPDSGLDQYGARSNCMCPSCQGIRSRVKQQFGIDENQNDVKE